MITRNRNKALLIKMTQSNRQELLDRLKSDTFDLLVIGGGASGCGVALEAASRGLKVALVERDDYAAETSSRSTKLVHGGVRYLEQAALHLDSLQAHLVQDALGERSAFFKIAPFLTRRLPILTPIYRWHLIPYYWIGLKLYDWIAGKGSLGSSHFLSKSKALKRFPCLNKTGLWGAVVYYDGQFNDARMALLLALTAITQGGCLLNHCEVTALQVVKGGLSTATVVDQLCGETIKVRARSICNATGPFTDRIRQMDDPLSPKLIQASSGTHLILDRTYCPTRTGLLIPNTRDGRILFLLPWEGHTLAGTTDCRATVQTSPRPTREDIRFILDHLGHYFEKAIPESAVLSAWTGLRPLVDTGAATAKLSRDHLIETSESGLLTLTGGKWTTYRKMAEDLVDTLNPPHSSKTKQLPLLGCEGYSKNLPLTLQKRYGVSRESSLHLARSYGGRATELLEQAASLRLLVEGEPILEAEVSYACNYEHACRVVDVLARRTRLAFIDRKKAGDSMERVLLLMTKALMWSPERVSHERKAAQHFLATMGE
jgi:glycerol-3-phosphate dehydrogenase